MRLILQILLGFIVFVLCVGGCRWAVRMVGGF